MSTNQSNVISVSYENLDEAANIIMEKVNAMRSALDKATNAVNRTEDSYQMEAADDLREQYRALTTKFPDFEDAITNYATFLRSVAKKYNETDQKLRQQAENLTSDYSE